MNIKREKRDYSGLRRIIIVILVLSFIFAGIYFFLLKKPVCGDGTVYNSCSNRKPYFCDNGILVEKASVCGCFENLTIEEDSCFSRYQLNPKKITLKYILRGEEKNMDFVVYKRLTNYLSKLPQEISHDSGENISRIDFKLKKLNEEEQRYLLLPLVTQIQNSADNEKDRIRIAISIVQNIPFGNSDKKISFHGNLMNYSRYPYEVLYDEKGICGEKAELLAFILREMGYSVAFFYYAPENHEAVAIKCPIIYGLGKTGCCFIETTGPSIITDSEIEYVDVGRLFSEPELIIVSEGKSIGSGWYEYSDAKILNSARRGIGIFREKTLRNLIEKYGLEDIYNV